MSSGQPWAIRSSSLANLVICSCADCRRGWHTLDFVFADVDEGGRVDDVAGEVEDHLVWVVAFCKALRLLQCRVACWRNFHRNPQGCSCAGGGAGCALCPRREVVGPRIPFQPSLIGPLQSAALLRRLPC